MRAEGVRRTIAIPAAGGQAAREVVVETWTAADLQIALREDTNDPLLGEVDTHVMAELHTEEPPPGLFQVPADYQRVDERGRLHDLDSPAIASVGSRGDQPGCGEVHGRGSPRGGAGNGAAVGGDRRTGRARDVQVERGLEPGLDQEAIKAVQQWRFRPPSRTAARCG